jgi:tRNA dimethylallyltransferase
MTLNLTTNLQNISQKPKVIAVVGATASGKTKYSIELAKEINGEIISADSRLVYKGFNIVCAKPTLEERQGIPHYMMDIVEPEENYSAGLYSKAAKKIIYDIISKGKTPIIVGGTGLYFRLLLENYEPPKVEPNYDYRKELDTLSKNELYELLKSIDFDGAQSINPNDRKKLIRAIEIVKFGDKSLDESRSISAESEFDVEWIGRNYPREELYERINKRVDIMLENGMIEETKALLEKHGRIPNLTDTIGYHEIIMYLDKIITLDDAIERLKQNTRRYAKRQLTWFRKNKNINWNCYPETKTK